MRTVLLTGFEPFDQDGVNPSWEAVRQLDGVQLDDDVRIVARRLPCAFATASECLLQLISELRPAMVIATGLAPGRSEISIERVAINVNDADGRFHVVLGRCKAQILLPSGSRK